MEKFHGYVFHLFTFRKRFGMILKVIFLKGCYKFICFNTVKIPKRTLE